jgi:hypothetical protein
MSKKVMLAQTLTYASETLFDAIVSLEAGKPPEEVYKKLESFYDFLGEILQEIDLGSSSEPDNKTS